MGKSPACESPSGSAGGTYILILHLLRDRTLQIGKLGRFDFKRGWYLYVGSAFGPGGVAARCRHHRRLAARPRWHIDYLRSAAPLRAIWFSHAPAPLERLWAGLLADPLGLKVPAAGFGASDCGCPGHLFYVSNRPDLWHYSLALGSEDIDNISVYCETL